jgi:thiol:disulfide interchange protein DsbD
MVKPRYLFLIFFLLLGFSSLVRAVNPEDLLPQEKAFALSVQLLSADQVSLRLDIAEGYYLYRNKFKFIAKSPGSSLGSASFPEGHKKQDEFFGEMEIYRGPVEIILPVHRDDPSVNHLELEVTTQGCADVGVCFPPFKRSFPLNYPPAATAEQKDLSQLLNRTTHSGIGADELLPADQAFQFLAEVKDAQTLHVSWQIAPGYYLYRDRIRLSLQNSPGVTLKAFELPHGATKQEETGPVETLHDEIGFDLPLQRSNAAATSVQLAVRYQGCAEKGVCYPFQDKLISLDLPAASMTSAPSSSTPPVAGNEQDRIADSLKNGSVWLSALSFFGFGLLMAFSPCLFPMIPILSGIVAGHGAAITTVRAFWLSLVYVLASALTYTAFGILAGLFGGNLQAAFQNPWIIGSFSALFVVLSLSMFDFYTLQMPSFIQERVARVSHRQKGGTLLGAAIMGALSALIVGPCMAAPLAGALIYIGQTGDALLGGVALFSMGMGMGVPLVIIGTSAGKLLPRAGMWMNAVKAVFGVGLLAVAVSLLERIVPPALALFLWALLLIVPSIYLGALEPLPAQASGWQKLWKGLGVVLLIYGILQLVGVATDGSDPLQPLHGLTSPVNGNATGVTGSAQKSLTIKTPEELDRVLAESRSQGRWLLLDYYADWCVSCKEMERYTFGDASVRAALHDWNIVRVDVTGTEQAEKTLLSRYGLVGPPAILFFAPDGTERRAQRLVGFMKAAEFLNLLNQLRTS